MGTARLSAVVLAVIVAVVTTACGGSSTPAAATNFGATLAGSGEVPATTSTATGTATFSLSGTTMTYTVTYSGLSGNPTGSHIHVGASTATGPVVVAFSGLPAATSGTFTGTFTAADIKPSTTPVVVNTLDDLLTQLRAGNAYANIHTAANGGGEIRGQIAGK